MPDGSPLPAWLGPFFHVARSFLDNRGLALASALSYATVLSIVPFLAVAFALAKGLGFYDTPQVRDWLLRLTAGRADVADHILTYIQNTNMRTLGATGAILLVSTAVSLVSTIEGAVNAAWGVTVRRGLKTRFTNYFVLIVLCPPLLFAAVSAMASLRALHLTQRILQIPLLGEMGQGLLAVTPVLAIWAAFYMLYQFLPNTRVKPGKALIGGIIAGSLWQIVQWAYITFQFGSRDYNAIYGSFAQIPLLLLWLYVSWVIVLLGAQIAHTAQGYAAFVRDARAATVSPGQRHVLGLFLALLAARNARLRRPSPPVDALAAFLGLPVATVAAIVADLARAGLATQGQGADAARFAPLPPDEDVRVSELVRALDDADSPLPAAFAAIDILPALRDDLAAGGDGSSLKDLLARHGALLEKLPATLLAA